MCDLVSLIGAGVAILSAAGTAAQQQDNQRRQVNYQSRVQTVTANNAAKAANADYVATLERISQARQAAANETFDATRAAERAQSSLATGAEAAGLGASGSVGDLRMAIAQQSATDHAVRVRNMDWQEQQILRSMDQIQSQQSSRVNSTIGSPVPGIDYAGLIGRLGSDLGNNYSQYEVREDIRRRNAPNRAPPPPPVPPPPPASN